MVIPLTHALLIIPDPAIQEVAKPVVGSQVATNPVDWQSAQYNKPADQYLGLHFIHCPPTNPYPGLLLNETAREIEREGGRDRDGRRAITRKWNLVNVEGKWRGKKIVTNEVSR